VEQEEEAWICPIVDQRDSDSVLEAILEGFAGISGLRGEEVYSFWIDLPLCV
jgi:hypothetical protein